MEKYTKYICYIFGDDPDVIRIITSFSSAEHFRRNTVPFEVPLVLESGGIFGFNKQHHRIENLLERSIFEVLKRLHKLDFFDALMEQLRAYKENIAYVINIAERISKLNVSANEVDSFIQEVRTDLEHLVKRFFYYYAINLDDETIAQWFSLVRRAYDQYEHEVVNSIKYFREYLSNDCSPAETPFVKVINNERSRANGNNSGPSNSSSSNGNSCGFGKAGSSKPATRRKLVLTKEYEAYRGDATNGNTEKNNGEWLSPQVETTHNKAVIISPRVNGVPSVCSSSSSSSSTTTINNSTTSPTKTRMRAMRGAAVDAHAEKEETGSNTSSITVCYYTNNDEDDIGNNATGNENIIGKCNRRGNSNSGNGSNVGSNGGCGVSDISSGSANTARNDRCHEFYDEENDNSEDSVEGAFRRKKIPRTNNNTVHNSSGKNTAGKSRRL